MKKIYLDGQMRSPCDWSAQKQEAAHTQDKILWVLDLGLFKRLPFPLHHQPQFLALGLSVDHFVNSIWTEFETQSVGVCLYEGTPDYSQTLLWDSVQEENWQKWLKETHIQEMNEPWLKKLYCRDVCVSYLDLIGKQLPDRIPGFVHLERISDPLEHAVMCSNESYGHLQFLNKEAVIDIKIGLCLPPPSCRCFSYYKGLKEVLLSLTEPYRVIPESMLTTEWDELDVIYVGKKGVTPTGQRKLDGFIAAGGIVHFL